MRFRFLKPKFSKREKEIMKVCCEVTLKSIVKRQVEGKTEPIEDEVRVDLEKIIKKIV
jgi:hypothetical protein